MKKYIHEVENIPEELNQIEAMSIINPMLCKKLTIQVEVEQRDEGPIPHMHVYHDKTRNPRKCSYVRLDTAEYSAHHKNNVPLPRRLKEQFLDVMYEPIVQRKFDTSEGSRYLTGYEQAVDTWVATFEDGDYSKFNLDKDGELIPPDYTKL